LPPHNRCKHRLIALLDLNNDGTNDFRFDFFASKTSHDCSYGSFCRIVFLDVIAESKNRVVGQDEYAVALKPGVSVRSASSLGGDMAFLKYVSGKEAIYGQWANGGKGVWNRYLGLKFLINGEVHYGWARLRVSVKVKYEINWTLTGYAYETIPNKPIITGKTHGKADVEYDPGPGASLTSPIPDKPQPASLGALALGAPGLSIWRREESVEVKQ